MSYETRQRLRGAIAVLLFLAGCFILAVGASVNDIAALHGAAGMWFGLMAFDVLTKKL